MNDNQNIMTQPEPEMYLGARHLPAPEPRTPGGGPHAARRLLRGGGRDRPGAGARDLGRPGGAGGLPARPLDRAVPDVAGAGAERAVDGVGGVKPNRKGGTSGSRPSRGRGTSRPASPGRLTSAIAAGGGTRDHGPAGTVRPARGARHLLGARAGGRPARRHLGPGAERLVRYDVPDWNGQCQMFSMRKQSSPSATATWSSGWWNGRWRARWWRGRVMVFCRTPARLRRRGRARLVGRRAGLPRCGDDVCRPDPATACDERARARWLAGWHRPGAHGAAARLGTRPLELSRLRPVEWLWPAGWCGASSTCSPARRASASPCCSVG